MWRNIKRFNCNSLKFSQLFVYNSKRFQHDEIQTNFPLISPLLSHRLLGKSQFLANVDEETILELLQSISDIPVQPSEFKFLNFKDLPHSKTLPLIPNELNDDSIIEYVHQLTNFQYNRQNTSKISEILMEIVNYKPILLTKEEYLKIIRFFHHTSHDSICYKILNIMSEKTNIKQDIDFDNIILSKSAKPSMYKLKIERLEVLKGKNWESNCNTWYSIFHMFNNPEPQIQMLELMDEYQVSTMPILRSLNSITKFLSAERLLSIYEKNGITLKNKRMDSILLNQLVACYLKDNRIEEIWKIITNNNDYELKKFINHGLFVVFTTHFIKNNQIAYAFALSKFFKLKYNIDTNSILRSMLINIYLKDCPYFDNWVSLARLLYPVSEKSKGFINSKTISNLNDYCDLHNIREDLTKIEKKDLELMKSINSNLVWNKNPIFKLSRNDPKFIEIALKLGQKD